ncbi:MAG: type VI secretion system lipoprotein TssJ [Cellvibrionaceae bacterium]
MITNRTFYIFLFFMLTQVQACTTAAKVTAKVWKPYDEINIETAANVNPDGKNRPSPIQVKIYELSSRSTFDNLDFDRAFYSAKTLLSDQLLSEVEYTIQPGEKVEHTVQLNKKVGFIAITASFIDIDNARWKHIYEVKPHGHYNHHISISEKEIKEGKLKKSPSTKDNLKKGKDTIESGKDTIKKGQDSVDKVNETKDSIENLRSKKLKFD